MNVLDALPKSVHGRAKAFIKEPTETENKKEAERAIEEFTSGIARKVEDNELNSPNSWTRFSPE